MLFVVAHEMGHAVISELKLPVLGREEDAADTFAIIAALTGVANDFSYRVLGRPPRARSGPPGATSGRAPSLRITIDTVSTSSAPTRSSA